MAAGDLITSDFDFEYNGAVFGNGNNGVDLVQLAGLDDQPAVRTFDRERSLRHGFHAGEDLFATRTLELALEVWGSTAAELRDNLEALEDAFLLQSTELPLVTQIPGHVFTKQRVVCRPRNRSAPLTRATAVGYLTEVVIQLEATDPRLYDNNLQSVTTSVTTETGGLSMPLELPLTFGGTGDSGTIQAVNGGNFPAPWTARIDGPITNPQIENVDTGQIIQLGLSVASGDYLLLESDLQLVLLNGATSRSGELTSDSVWWDLAAGTTNLRFTGTTSGSPQLTVSWRSARV